MFGNGRKTLFVFTFALLFPAVVVFRVVHNGMGCIFASFLSKLVQLLKIIISSLSHSILFVP